MSDDSDLTSWATRQPWLRTALFAATPPHRPELGLTATALQIASTHLVDKNDYLVVYLLRYTRWCAYVSGGKIEWTMPL